MGYLSQRYAPTLTRTMVRWFWCLSKSTWTGRCPATLRSARRHGAMLSLFYAWGNRAAWIAAAIIAVLFFYAVIYAFPNARQAAMQQQRDAIERENRAFREKCGRLFGIPWDVRRLRFAPRQRPHPAEAHRIRRSAVSDSLRQDPADGTARWRAQRQEDSVRGAAGSGRVI